jgi:lipid-binding SYLF domain-containing protein
MLGERVMRNGMLIAVTLFTFLFSSGAEAGIFGKKKDTDEQRQEVLDMREETLSRLYGEKASAEAIVKDSVGYAVFSNTGINVLLVSTANGSGIAHDNKSGADVYMKMFSAGGGIGLGVKKFSAVFVFHSRDAYDQFVDKGWNFTAQADAAATTDADSKEQAGATDATVGLNQGVTVYQMTKKGLALQATLQGTKYWKDDDLN